MGGEREVGVKGDAEDLRSFCKEKRNVVDGNIGMEVGLMVVWGEEGNGGFVGGNREAIGGGPVRNG